MGVGATYGADRRQARTGRSAILNGDPAQSGLSTVGTGSKDQGMPSFQDPFSVPVGGGQPPAPAPAPAPVPVDPMNLPVAMAPVSQPAPVVVPAPVPVDPMNLPVAAPVVAAPAVAQPSAPVGKIPLGVRNNNPGNIRFVGQSGAQPGENGFARFNSYEEGIAAMDAQIMRYMNGATTGKPLTNIQDIIRNWAPSSENDTGTYINFVASKTGINPLQTLSTADIPKIRDAMIEMEIGMSKEQGAAVAAGQPFGGATPITAFAGRPSSGFSNARLDSLLQQANAPNAELQQLYELMKAKGAQTQPVRDPLERDLMALTGVLTGQFGNKDFSSELDKQVKFDQGIVKDNNSAEMDYMNRLIQMATSQRSWVGQQYEKAKREATAEEGRVFKVAEAVLGNNPETLGVVLAAIGADPEMGPRLASFDDIQLTRIFTEKAKEMGLSLNKPPSTRGSNTGGAGVTATGEWSSDLDYINESNLTNDQKKQYSNMHINLAGRLEEGKALANSIRENARFMGAASPIISLLNGVNFNVNNILGLVDASGALLSDTYGNQLREAARNIAGIDAQRTMLVFQVARALNGSGVLTDADVRRADQIIPDPSAITADPMIVAQIIEGEIGRLVKKDYATLERLHNSMYKDGRKFPLQEPTANASSAPATATPAEKPEFETRVIQLRDKGLTDEQIRDKLLEEGYE